MRNKSTNTIYVRYEKSMKHGSVLKDSTKLSRMSKRKEATGFSLIEMIISVVILLLLLGLTLVGYGSYNEKHKVKQAALTLKSNLRMARMNAISGKKPSSCVTQGDMFEGYAVSFTQSSYTVVPRCHLSEEIIGEKVAVNLPTPITFSPVPSSFVYYPVTQGVSSGQSIILISGNTSVTLVIDGLSGEISD